MIRTVSRWSFPAVCVLVVGPLLARPVGALRGLDGGPDVSIFVSSSPIAGLGALLALLVAAGVVAYVAAILAGPRLALTASGLIVAWGAWMTGDAGGVIRAAPEASTLIRFSIEGLIMGCGAVLVFVGVCHAARKAPDAVAEHPIADLTGALRTSAGLLALGAGTAAALAAVAILARESLPGQAIFAAVIAGVSASLASSATGGSERGQFPVLIPLVSVALAAVIAPLVGLVAPGAPGLAEAATLRSLPGPLNIQPIDWLVAGVLGAPIGLGWAGVLAPDHGTERHHQQHPSAA